MPKTIIFLNITLKFFINILKKPDQAFGFEQLCDIIRGFTASDADFLCVNFKRALCQLYELKKTNRSM